MKKTIAAILVVLVALLCGCTSLKDDFDGIIDWMKDPKGLANSAIMEFKVSASASTERQALLLAYKAASDAISEETGVQMSQEHIRELSTLGTISEMNLKTEDIQTSAFEGTFTVELTISVDREYLESITTDEARARRTLEADIEAIVAEGDELMKQGEDIKAVILYLQSMELSYGADFIDEEYSFEVMREEVVSILSKLNLRLVSSDSSTATARIRATRQRSFFSYSLDTCPVTARIDVYSQYTSDEKLFLSYYTTENGVLDFQLSNTMAKRNGTVRFTFGIENALENLQKLTGEDACAPIRAILDEKSVSFTYVLGETYGTTAVAASVYDGSSFSDGAELSTYIADKLVAEGITAKAVATSGSDEDDVLKAEALAACPGCSYIVVVKVGVRDTVKSETGFSVVFVEGRVEIWKVSDSSLVFSTGVVSSSSMKTSREEAFREASSVLVQGAYESLRQQYV